MLNHRRHLQLQFFPLLVLLANKSCEKSFSLYKALSPCSQGKNHLIQVSRSEDHERLKIEEKGNNTKREKGEMTTPLQNIQT